VAARHLIGEIEVRFSGIAYAALIAAIFWGSLLQVKWVFN